MATLVLTTLGTVVGGPIGGAVGALLGQTVDRSIFRAAVREGPRLTELAVQTSSYGSQIPKLFGTMRIAGTVIWASDLIETRTISGGGKGRSGTASYSYAASFAVLLSARAVAGVGRIWADGTLIRGAAGDWKMTTGFRLHGGGEEQAADPLIASAEGGAAPAHRGCAYAVFEGLPLEGFGNRIPSLTFEVIADPGAMSVGAIAAALADEVDDAGTATTLDGFAATGTRVSAVLDTLAMLGGAWWEADGARLTMRDAAAAAPLAIADDGAARRVRSVAPADATARRVTVAHYDPARDYQVGVQRASRPGPSMREERVELPAALSATAAKAVAEALLARGETGRTRRTVTTGLAGLGVAPGASVTIAGEAGTWRVAAARTEGLATALELLPVTRVPALAALAASSGRIATAEDRPIGATLLHAFEMPVTGDALATAPRLTIAAAGEGAGWRRAALFYSLDDGAGWIAAGSTAAPATLGRIVAVAGSGPAALVDRRGAFEVVLARPDMALGDADMTALDAGANAAMLGDELVQFGRAEPLGDGCWRLSALWRGRRGTEFAIGTQAPGDRFVLLQPDAIRMVELPASAIGARVRVMASGVGDAAGPVEAEAAIGGVSVAPPAPVAGTARRTPSGDLVLGWTRRSRAGWRWTDGVDAPLAEERERYRVTLTGGDGERIVEVGEPAATIAAGDLPAGPLAIAVRQLGTLALSRAMTITGDEE